MEETVQEGHGLGGWARWVAAYRSDGSALDAATAATARDAVDFGFGRVARALVSGSDGAQARVLVTYEVDAERASGAFATFLDAKAMVDAHLRSLNGDPAVAALGRPLDLAAFLPLYRRILGESDALETRFHEAMALLPDGVLDAIRDAGAEGPSTSRGAS